MLKFVLAVPINSVHHTKNARRRKLSFSVQSKRRQNQKTNQSQSQVLFFVLTAKIFATFHFKTQNSDIFKLLCRNAWNFLLWPSISLRFGFKIYVSDLCKTSLTWFGFVPVDKLKFVLFFVLSLFVESRRHISQNPLFYLCNIK